MIDVVSGISKILSHVTTTSLTRRFVHMHSFRFSPCHNPCHTHRHIRQVSKHNHLRILDVSLPFYIYSDIYLYSIFVVNDISYHQIHTFIHMKYALLIIHLLLLFFCFFFAILTTFRFKYFFH